MISFYEYMIQNYLFTHGPESGLANDMFYDKSTFPKTDNYKVIHDYLTSFGACSECMNVFEKCFKEYKEKNNG